MVEENRYRLTMEEFLERLPDRQTRAAIERLKAVAEENDGFIYLGDSGISIRRYSPVWRTPLSIAWVYPPGERGWMRLRDFSFGAGAGSNGWFETLPENLRQTLERWADSFSQGLGAMNVSSAGLNAWAISHQDAAANIDLLAQRLDRVLRELGELEAPDG